MKLTDDEIKQRKAEYSKKYYEQHKEKLKKYAIDRYSKNREEILAYNRKERKINKANTEKVKEWMMKNPDRLFYRKEYYWNVTRLKRKAIKAVNEN